MPNKIDTRRMIPVKPEMHARLKRELESLKVSSGNKNKTFNDLLEVKFSHKK